MQGTCTRSQRWVARAAAMTAALVAFSTLSASVAMGVTPHSAEASPAAASAAPTSASAEPTTVGSTSPSPAPNSQVPGSPSATPSTSATPTAEETPTLGSPTPVPTDTLPASAAPQPEGRALPRAAAAPLGCDAGQFYAQSDSGRVYALSSSDSTINASATLAFDFTQGNGDSSSSFNGLAIGAGGQVAYAYGRGSSKLYRWDAATGSVAAWGLTLPRLPGNVEFPISSLIAGGMNPSITNSPYYFGGWRKVGSQYRFELFSVVGTGSVTYLGWVQGPTSNSDGGNGDLAFNSDGDLFLLWSDGAGSMQIVSVPSGTLNAAGGGQIGGAPTSRIVSVPSGQYNGVAFGVDGAAYLGKTVGNRLGRFEAVVTTVDPNTGAVLGAATTLQGGDFGTPSWGGTGRLTDLASCADPSSLELRKSIQGRASAQDQFTLLIQQNNTSVASVTTQGTQTTASAGPVVAQRGKQYQLSEAMASGSANPLSAYSTSFSCVDTANNNAAVTVSGSGASYSLIVPTARRTHIVCTFVNSAGMVTWAKTDATNGQPLGATTWRLNGPQDTVIPVTDNVGQAGYSGVDQDPLPGRFRVPVGLGDYSLVEVSAPAGYVVDTTPRPFTVTAANRTVDLGAISNKRVPGTVTWSKVGPTSGLLAGSRWRLTPTNPSGAAIDISDNTGQAGYTGRDTDPVAGQFAVTGLSWGDYSLVEVAAPVGYVVNGTPKSITISADQTTVGVGAIVNQPSPGVKLPLTGGEGALRYWIAGMLLFVVAVGAAVLHRSHRHPHRR